MAEILHIATKAAWDEAQRQGVYRAPSLEREEFIHFSTPAQVLAVANAIYRGEENLVLLYMSPEKLTAELRYEALETPQTYPHLYGPLNLEAVVQVAAFPPRADGTFSLPQPDSIKAYSIP